MGDRVHGSRRPVDVDAAGTAADAERGDRPESLRNGEARPVTSITVPGGGTTASAPRLSIMGTSTSTVSLSR